MNINIKAEKQNTYDAIVVGSGISGGWAAKELTEKGLKVLMLERGRNVEHVTDYDTALLKPWEFNVEEMENDVRKELRLTVRYVDETSVGAKTKNKIWKLFILQAIRENKDLDKLI